MLNIREENMKSWILKLDSKLRKGGRKYGKPYSFLKFKDAVDDHGRVKND